MSNVTQVKNIALTNIGDLTDTFIRSICVDAITEYQKYISPYKGYSCCYRILYNKSSCSQEIKEYIQKFGLISAIPKIMKRFQDCQKASNIMKQKRSQYIRFISSLPTRNERRYELLNLDPITICAGCCLLETLCGKAVHG